MYEAYEVPSTRLEKEDALGAGSCIVTSTDMLSLCCGFRSSSRGTARSGIALVVFLDSRLRQNLQAQYTNAQLRPKCACAEPNGVILVT